MQDPHTSRPRSSSMASLHQRAAQATCGLLRRPSQQEQEQQHQYQHQQETMHSLDQQPSSSIPRRRTSLRERFWSVNSANVLKEADRERRQRDAAAQAQAAYTTPRRHTAEMTQQRRAPAGDAVLYDTLHEGEEVEDAGGRGDDYALFVERSEMLQEANRREEAMMLGTGTSRTNNSGRNRNRRSLSRRIADYVKPPRDEA